MSSRIVNVYSIYRLVVRRPVMMLPLVLVILFAHSALSAPSTVSVRQVSSDEYPWPRDTGSLVNGYLIESGFGVLDTGDLNIHTLTALNILVDMANSPDPATQAMALGQAVNIIGEAAAGSPGDACEYAALANAHASGNPIAVRQALGGYVSRLNRNLNAIAQLAANPGAGRSIVGASSGCAGGGRQFEFETIWDTALANANAYTIGLLNEQYCTARRLYGSHNGLSNNLAAVLSASTVPQVVGLLQNCVPALSNVLRILGTDGDVASAVAVAQNAVARAAAGVY